MICVKTFFLLTTQQQDKYITITHTRDQFMNDHNKSVYFMAYCYDDTITRILGFYSFIIINQI